MSTIDTLTVAVGIDASDLESGADRATGSVRGLGDETEGLGNQTRRTSRRTRDFGGGLDRVGQSADDLDTRAMGFRDTMTGVQDTMLGTSQIAKGNLFEGFLLLGMGIGDLASGVANFGVQMVKTAGTFIAQQARMLVAHMANAARMAAGWLIAMGPIALVVLAIAAIIGILYALGVDFDTVKEIAAGAWQFIQDGAQSLWSWLQENWPLLLAILTGPFGLAVLAIVRNWDRIKGAASAAKDFIGARLSDIVGFVTGMPGRIGRAASGIFDGITRALRTALNAAISLWNGFDLTLGPFSFGGQSLPGPLPDIPAVTVGPWTLGSPHIPRLAEGGIVTGPTLAMIGEGGHDEAVIPLPRGARDFGSGPREMDLDVHVTGDEMLAAWFEKNLRTSRLTVR